MGKSRPSNLIIKAFWMIAGIMAIFIVGRLLLAGLRGVKQEDEETILDSGYPQQIFNQYYSHRGGSFF